MEMEPKIAKIDKWTCLKTIEKLHGGRIISQEEKEEGVAVRVKIVVSKQELRKMVASMSQKNSSAADHRMAAPPSLEQPLHVLRKRRMKAAETTKGCRPGEWRPALHSIPEEI